MTALSDKLRELRGKAGYSVRGLAEELGKSPGYISRIEGRGEIPSAELLCELAALFGVKPEMLLELAKSCQLAETADSIEEKHKSALVLFRKGKK